MMDIRVKKFGGTSLSSIQKIEQVAERLAEDRNEKAIVVLSAMSGYTNSLIDMAHQIYPDFQGPAYDLLISSGEQISIALLSLALEKRGVKNQALLGHQAGIKTNSFFSKAEIESIETGVLKKLLRENVMPLVAGFQGITKDNQITTLGRGGSDLTAVAITAALNLPVCEIYTDVTGVFTADPKIVSQAYKIKELGFSEMMEMASSGSKVLQIRSVELAGKNKVKIHVLHSIKREEGTWIVNKKEAGMEGSVVSAIAHDLSTQVIRLKNLPKGIEFISKLFSALGQANIFVDMISQMESDEKARVSFSILKTDLPPALKVLKKLVPEDDIVVIDQVAKISVVGVGMAHNSGVAGRFFHALKKGAGQIYLVTTSEIKISAVIAKEDLKKSAKALHEEFFPKT